MAAWRFVAVGVAVLLVLAYAIGSGRWVETGSVWYQSLQQPAWQPPDPVFGLAWAYNFTVLAIVGVVMAWRAEPVPVAAFLGSFAVSVLLALAWAYLFYVPHALVAAALALTAAALVTVIPVVVSIAELGWVGWLLVPYLGWLAVASSLSWGYAATA